MKTFFSTQKNQLKETQDMSRQELVELTITHFTSMFAKCEVEGVFEGMCIFLAELEIEDEDFDLQYDRIILGTVILSLSLIEWVDYPSSDCGVDPLSLKSLMDSCHIYPNFLRSARNPDVKNLIISIGKKVLEEKSLPLHECYLNAFSVFAAKTGIHLERRLEKYGCDKQSAKRELVY